MREGYYIVSCSLKQRGEILYFPISNYYVRKTPKLASRYNDDVFPSTDPGLHGFPTTRTLPTGPLRPHGHHPSTADDAGYIFRSTPLPFAGNQGPKSTFCSRSPTVNRRRFPPLRPSPAGDRSRRRLLHRHHRCRFYRSRSPAGLRRLR